jgi:exonuclease III
MTCKSALSIVTWNIGKGLSHKILDSEFISIIDKTDIICLLECWITEFDYINIPNYYSFIFPRKNGRGCGIVIFVKYELKDSIFLIDNIHDCIIWLKYTQARENTYFAFCYFPQENSIFYIRDNVETGLFQRLEDTISLYKDCGKIIITGDLTARTGIRPDYREHDDLNMDLRNLLSIFEYEFDSESRERRNTDKHVNSFGRNLLSICQSSNLRIVNGRHENDPQGSFTFCGANGTSLIDYVIVQKQYFDAIVYFETGNFVTFSDHSPVYFKIPIVKCVQKDTQVTDEDTCRCIFKSVRWNSMNVDSILQILLEYDNNLKNIIFADLNSQRETDTCVSNFCDILKNIVLPFCDVCNPSTRRNNLSTKKCSIEDKPCFNEACKQKYKDYKNRPI